MAESWFSLGRDDQEPGSQPLSATRCFLNEKQIMRTIHLIRTVTSFFLRQAGAIGASATTGRNTWPRIICALFGAIIWRV